MYFYSFNSTAFIISKDFFLWLLNLFPKMYSSQEDFFMFKNVKTEIICLRGIIQSFKASHV